jgi:hypothetical protein
MKTKLITAEQARELREDSITNFKIIGMEKYINYLDKKIRETSERGNFGFSLWIEFYCGITPDPVISELSPVQMQQLIFHLVENGYRAYLEEARLYVYWNSVVQQDPEPVEKEKPKKLTWLNSNWFPSWD